LVPVPLRRRDAAAREDAPRRARHDAIPSYNRRTLENGLEARMTALLRFSRFVDALNARIGKAVTWLVLAAVVISAANAIIRKVFDYSSNAWLEIQWYLFSAIFLLCAGYTLLRNEHIRIDVVAGRFSRRTQTWIDVFGTIFFLIPMVALVLYEAWPWFVRAYASGEISSSAGGLTLWPAKILVPIGFVLLGLQGLSELIKRIAFLRGLGPDPADKGREKSAEEALAEEIRKQHGETA
jgi:TRAP-type mannitol/chloroaromatic compound transport system permease small subunit